MLLAQESLGREQRTLLSLELWSSFRHRQALVCTFSR